MKIVISFEKELSVKELIKVLEAIEMIEGEYDCKVIHEADGGALAPVFVPPLFVDAPQPSEPLDIDIEELISKPLYEEDEVDMAGRRRVVRDDE